ncbi:hypothetical protein [uncultured Pseudokineococcus sp.]|uniref:hypothetical protein n=1 Tax=uncultured Pseudokineococcus sp. TaxID=1642928 RepID=UPI00263048D7|nr:hypothetical protein [uncultured Pseudokineococcus sp.]
MAEELARQRERAARQAEQQSIQAARDLQERMAAERTTARASLAPIERDAWWERATPRDIEAAWQTARQWQDVEPDARRASETIREQVRTRYGIDVDALDPDRQSAVSRVMSDRARQEQETAERAAQQSAQERSEADQERVVATLLVNEAADGRVEANATAGSQDVAPARGQVAGLEQEADRLGQEAAAADSRAVDADADADAERGAALGAAARAEGRSDAARKTAPAYDSAERRVHTRADLESKLGSGYEEVVEARMLADMANARPPGDVAHEREPVAQAAGGRRLLFGRGRGQAYGVER